MSLAQFNEVSVAFAAQKVLDGITASVHEGERIGLIGANGTGKTTLLRLLACTLKPDTGTIAIHRGLRVGFLEQEPNLPKDANVHDAALSAFADVLEVEARMRAVEHEIAHAAEEKRGRLLHELGELQEKFQLAGGYEHERRTVAVLTGLGFSEEMFTRPVSVLSGGERSRLALACLLLREADILLLDEPTNHLDLDGIEWLEDFLRKTYRGGVLMVSHDRTFLDRTVTRIFELEHARLAAYPGNYSKYVGLKEARILAQQRAYEKQQEFIRKEEEFYRKYHAAQRSKEAKGRMKRLSRLERIEAPKRKKEMKVRFGQERDSSQVCVRLEGLQKQYDGRTLFDQVEMEIYRGERIGIIGANGTGKTTLLKVLLGEAEPDGGKVVFGRHATVGYLPQVVDDANSGKTVLDEVWERKRTLDEVEVRNVLGRFLFSGDDEVNKRLEDLSGGERKRVSLACLMIERPSVLFLDEPTNHLDIPSRVALEAALADYPGTVIAVSHDRYFLNLIAQRLIVVDGERSRVVYGTYDDYERMKAQAEKSAVSATGEQPVKEMPEPTAAKPKRRLSKNRLAKLEKDIAALEAEKEELEKLLADPALYADAERSQSVPRQYKTICEELEKLYLLWANES